MITNDLLRTRYKQVSAAVTGIVIILLYLTFIHRPNYYREDMESVDLSVPYFTTANTQRVYGRNIYETVTGITRTAYPALYKYDRPNAVILVGEEKKADGILAARLSHPLINAPVLYTQTNEIPQEMLRELKRLNPRGINADRNNKVILIGDLGEAVKEKLRSEGLKFRHITGSNPFVLGKNIDEYMTSLVGRQSNQIILAPIEEMESALVQASWSAYSGNGFLFIKGDSVPEETELALKKRKGKLYIYLLGNQNIISPRVQSKLSTFAHVQRIPRSEDIYSQSAAFAAYSDTGRATSWWLGSRTRSFGWGVTRSGNNFIFVNPIEWHTAVTACILSTKGKQGPMLLIQRDRVPEAVRAYLNLVKPSYISPQNQLYNHGWIIGSPEQVSIEVQSYLDQLMDHERSGQSE